jgi:hypothetical protein
VGCIRERGWYGGIVVGMGECGCYGGSVGGIRESGWYGESVVGMGDCGWYGVWVVEGFGWYGDSLGGGMGPFGE